MNHESSVHSVIAHVAIENNEIIDSGSEIKTGEDCDRNTVLDVDSDQYKVCTVTNDAFDNYEGKSNQDNNSNISSRSKEESTVCIEMKDLIETVDDAEASKSMSVYASDDSDIEVLDIFVDKDDDFVLKETLAKESVASDGSEVPCTISSSSFRENSPNIGVNCGKKEEIFTDASDNDAQCSASTVKEATDVNMETEENNLYDINIVITDVRSLSEKADTNTICDNIHNQNQDLNQKENDTTVTSISQTVDLLSIGTTSANQITGSHSDSVNNGNMEQEKIQNETIYSTDKSNKAINSNEVISELQSETCFPTNATGSASSSAPILSSSLEHFKSIPDSSSLALLHAPNHRSLEASSSVSEAVPPLHRPQHSTLSVSVVSSPSLTKESPLFQTSPASSHASIVLLSSSLSMKGIVPESLVSTGPNLPVSSSVPPLTSVEVATTETSLYPSLGEITSIVNSESLPCFHSSANVVVKSEPIGNGIYGKVLNNRNIAHQNACVEHQSVTVHKGHKLKSTFANIPSAQKIVITKVNKMNSAVTSKPSLSASSPKVSYQKLLLKGLDNKKENFKQKKHMLDQTAKISQSLSTNKLLLPMATSSSIAPLPCVLAVRRDKEKEVTMFSQDVEQTPQVKLMSTINIHSVGVPRITDLIARKNPLPAYKPSPVPDHIKDSNNIKIHACYECGDNFYLAKSLQQHLGRSVMWINYKCEHCGNKLTFTNKCQLLSHLRSHLNIEKTQAVAIHIKSDSIEIFSNYDKIVRGKPFEWYKTDSEVVKPQYSFTANSAATSISTGICGQCKSVFYQKKDLIEHFEGKKASHFFCTECPMYLNSSCAMAAHKAFHNLAKISVDAGKLSADEWKLIKSLQCPECGMKFWELSSMNTSISSYIQTAVLHLKRVCFHLSRLTGFECVRCGLLCNGTSGLENHLQAYLEHYFKCELCPMALKSVKSVKAHFYHKHNRAACSEGLKAKVIYRCHVCDTLIDDKTFLVQHISMHIEEHKVNTSVSFHCLQCGEMFQQKSHLQKHTNANHLNVKRQFVCSCKRKHSSPLKYMMHVLDFNSNCHPIMTPSVETIFCERCGVVCVGKVALQNHTCLALKDAVVVGGDKINPDVCSQKSVSDGNNSECNKEKTSKDSPTNITSVDLPPHLSKKCVVCSVTFTSVDHREKHLRAHQSKDHMYVCINCDYKNAKTYHELRSHEISCSAIQKLNKSRILVGHSKTANETDLDEVQLTSMKVSKKQPVEVKEYFMCEQCGAMFMRKSQKEDHIKSEHGIHPCHLCGIVYNALSCLKKHLSTAHEGKHVYFYCKICKGHNIDKPFRYKETLIKHLKARHRAKVIDESNIVTKLPGCQVFDKESTPEAHSVKPSSSTSQESPIKKLRVAGEDVFKCAKCSYVSKCKDDFKQHILKHKTSETYQCLECGLCFAVFPALRKHVFIVHKIKDFENYMKENMIKEPAIMEDIDDAIREPPKKEAVSETSSAEEEESSSLECKVCYKQFDTMKNLVAHIRIHGMAFIRKNRRQAKVTFSKRKSGTDDVIEDNFAEQDRDSVMAKRRKMNSNCLNSDVERDKDLTENDANTSGAKDLITNNSSNKEPINKE